MERIRVLYPDINGGEIYEWLDRYKGTTAPFKADSAEQLLILLNNLEMMNNILSTWYQLNYDYSED